MVESTEFIISNVAFLGQQTLVEYAQCRTDEICTMYIEEFILVDVVTLLYTDEVNCTVLYMELN